MSVLKMRQILKTADEGQRRLGHGEIHDKRRHHVGVVEQ